MISGHGVSMGVDVGLGHAIFQGRVRSQHVESFARVQGSQRAVSSNAGFPLAPFATRST